MARFRLKEIHIVLSNPHISEKYCTHTVHENIHVHKYIGVYNLSGSVALCMSF
jgi:hypothetical protein